MTGRRAEFVAWGTVGLVALAASLASILPVALAPGFPAEHEGVNVFWRTTMMADLFRDGDWLPVWSPIDNAGFGSPFPAIYHRLFFWPAAGFVALADDCKDGILIGQVLFSFIGGIGIAALADALGASRAGRLAAPVLLIFANWTVTDWLVRGAYAECSALFLIPWVLLWFARLAEDGRIRWWIGPVLTGLYFAHSALAYAAVAIMTVCAGLFLLPRIHRMLTIRNAGPLAIATAIFAIFVLPQGYVSFQAGATVDVQFLITEMRPLASSKDLWRYFWDSGYRWGAPGVPYSVQLDSFVLAGLVASATGLALSRRTPAAGKGLSLVGLFILAGMLLQLRPLMWLYDAIPGFAYLQFPWRLLSLISPALIGIALGLAGSLARVAPVASLLIVLAMAGGTAATSGIFRNGDVALMSRAEIDGRPPADVVLYLEYLPRLPGLDARQTLPLLVRWRRDDAGPCRTALAPQSGRINRTYRISCTAATMARLPILATGVQRLHLPPGIEVLDSPPDEPRLGLRLPAGDTDIMIEPPTFSSILLHGMPGPGTRQVLVSQPMK